MSHNHVHQIVDVAMPGDAIFNCIADLQGFLADRGYDSRIYARDVAPALRGQVAAYRSLDDAPLGQVLIYHFGAGSEITDYLLARRAQDRIVLVYHNMTPPQYFRVADPLMASALEAGRSELAALSRRVALALAASEYNRGDLEILGYQDIGVLPPAHLGPRLAVPPDPGVLSRFGDGRSNILFIGRLVPNKRQEELIKLFYHFKPIDPSARLLIVGAPDGPGVYHKFLLDLTDCLRLSDVHFPGHVSQAELNAYYRVASVFVCLSEHEGFGVPLVESMHFGVPIVALATSAISETLGDAGVQVRRLDYLLMSELVRQLIADQGLRQAVIAAQIRQAKRFSREAVSDRFWSYLGPFLAAPA